MKIWIQFFGMLAEATGTEKYEISDFEGVDVSALRRHVLDQFPQLKSLTFMIALNKKIVTENELLTEENKIAFLPPFAGG